MAEFDNLHSPILFHNIRRQFDANELDFEALEKIIKKDPGAEQDNLAKLESELASFIGKKHGVLTGSGTDSVYLALRGLGIGPGDDVLVTAFSFIASASAIVRVGANPIFIDIDPATYLMDLNQLEHQVTSRSRALIAVHLYGQAVDIARTKEFCQQNGIYLVEDAAQALGAEHNQQKAGSFGEVSCISFNPTKVVGGIESGGAILTDNSEVASRIRQLTYHGKDLDDGLVKEWGLLSQMSEQNAHLLRQKLKLFSRWQSARDNIAHMYLDRLKSISALELPYIANGK